MSDKKFKNVIGIILINILFSNLSIFCSCHGLTEDEIMREVDNKIITCGSSVRIQNVMTKYK